MSATPASDVRPSAIAGTWYPGSPAALRQAITGFLDAVTPVNLPGPVLAVVCPHAGYAYSGPTAAHSYAQVRGNGAYRSVVLLGPLHRPIWNNRLGSFMVPSESAYSTPLGNVPLDRDLIQQLGTRVTLTPVHGDEEHALEIQLPFLQVALPGPFSVVPIMFGEHIAEPGAAGRVEHLASALAELIGSGSEAGSTLLVASTDLSHLHNYADVIQTDATLVERVAAFDVDGLLAGLRDETIQACGATGLIAALRTAQKLGAAGARVLDYRASGDVTGDKRPGIYTVGYVAAAVFAA